MGVLRPSQSGNPTWLSRQRTACRARACPPPAYHAPRVDTHSHHARAPGDDGGAIQARLPNEQVLQRARRQPQGAGHQDHPRGVPHRAGCAQGGGAAGAEVHILAHRLQWTLRRFGSGVASRVRDSYLLESNGSAKLRGRRLAAGMRRAEAERRQEALNVTVGGVHHRFGLPVRQEDPLQVPDLSRTGV